MTPLCRAFLWTCIALFADPWAARGADLPNGFVRLSDVTREVQQDIRYATPFNFTAAPLPGYAAPTCILTRAAAEALAKANARLQSDGFALKVFDCYRPRRAVRAMVDWSAGRGSAVMVPTFLPAVDRSRLVALGYVASRSAHSRGSTVDIGLVHLGEAALPTPTAGGPCNGPLDRRARESSVDLGTAFDCFDPASVPARA